MEELDKYSRVKLNDIKTITELLLSGNDIESALYDDTDDVKLHNKYSEGILGRKSVLDTAVANVTVEEYHASKANAWRIPDKYNKICILDELIDRCKSEEEVKRVEDEYKIYEERGLIDLLRFLFYLVDYMRDDKHMWGVGRGSSVSSYILYLIGIHKIDSLKYGLSVNEFLKD